MKKAKIIFLSLMAALSANVAKAEDSSLFFDPTPSDRFIELNVHAGAGLSTVIQNYGSAISGVSDFLLSPGCKVALGADVRFDINNSIGIGTGLDFGINNFRYAMSMVNGHTESISSLYVCNHFYDFTAPVYISFRFHLGDLVMWNLDGGLYFHNGFGGHTNISGYASGENELGQPIVTHASYSTPYFNAQQPLINGVNKFDWGPRIATGLMYKKKYTFNVVYQIGVRNLAVNQGVLDIKYRNMSLLFLFGYTF